MAGGAGVAGLIISASGDGFQMLFAIVLALSVLPTVGVWFGLREVRDDQTVTDGPTLPPEPETQLFRSRIKEFFRLLRELSGPASVRKILAGLGNIDEIRIDLPEAGYTGATLRLYSGMRLNRMWWWQRSMTLMVSICT